MKIVVKTFILLLLINHAYSQEVTNNYKSKVDSLQSLLSLTNHDSTRLMLLHSLAQVYAYNLQMVKSVETLHEAQELNKKLKYAKGYATEYRTICLLYTSTGLGLSLSYDIVKAHRGELKVETKEGAGSAFTINLPVT